MWGRLSMNSFELEGKWWLPNDEKNCVCGILKFDPKDGAKLKLFDSLNIENSRLTRYNDEILYEDIILGSTPGKVTLYKCYQVVSKEFDVEIIFDNYHFKNKDDIKFERLSITYPNFETWVGKSGLFLLEKDSEKGKKEQLFGYKQPDEIQVKLSNFEIKISFDFFPLPNPPSEIRLIQKTNLDVKSNEKIHFNEYNDEILYALYQFLTLSLGHAVYPLNISGFNESFKYKVFRKEINPEIKVFHERKRFSKLGKINKQDMLFSFSDISDNFEIYLKNWFEKVEDLEWVYNLYTATIWAKSMLIEHKFLSLVQALESYHQRAYDGKYMAKNDYKQIKNEIISNIPGQVVGNHRDSLKTKIDFGNDYSLKSRLDEIYDNYSEILDLVIDDKDTFIKDVRNTRNFFTHFSKSLEKKAKINDELVNLTDQIRCTLEVCLLAELGMSLNKIKDIIVRNERYKYLKN